MEALREQNKLLRGQIKKNKEKTPPKETKNEYKDKAKEIKKKTEQCNTEGDFIENIEKGEVVNVLLKARKEAGKFSGYVATAGCFKLGPFAFLCGVAADLVEEKVVYPLVEKACKKIFG
ncbi:unnamed protein product [Meloidogyne enterolobii]